MQAEAEKPEQSRQKKICLAMKTLNFEQMESLKGGGWKLSNRQVGCFYLGLAAGIAAALNPVVGGLTTLGCLLIT